MTKSTLTKCDDWVLAKESLDPRLDRVLERAARETSASYAFLLLRKAKATGVYCVASWGCEEDLHGLNQVAQVTLSSCEPLLMRTQLDAKRVMGGSLEQKLLPLICAPITDNGVPQGVLIVGSPSVTHDEFQPSLALILSLADLAGALLDNMSLRRELQRKEEKLGDLIVDTLNAQEKERERICLEVHDGVTQTLASAFQHLQTLDVFMAEGSHGRPLLLKASAMVKQGIQELREAINSLQPATLRDLGLVATLRHEMRQLGQELGWQIDFSADNIRFPKHIETALYRIIHEAITNARKHADTKRLRINLVAAGNLVKVEVKDWGTGFNYNGKLVRATDPPGANPMRMPRRHGTGLLSMRKRAELLQGMCDIHSIPGEGTAVHVEIPLTDNSMQYE